MGRLYIIAFKRNFIDNNASRRFIDILKTIRYRSEDKSMRCQTCIMGFTRYYSRIIFQDEDLHNGIPVLILTNASK